MLNDLILALTIISGAPQMTDQPAVAVARPGTAIAPSCVAGPVRARLRKSDRFSQVASAAIGRDVRRDGSVDAAQND